MLEFLKYTSMALLVAGVVLGALVGWRIMTQDQDKATTRLLMGIVAALMLAQFIIVLTVKAVYL